MWAVAGLGNPGRKYSKTRHNIGFIVLESIAEKYGIALDTEKKQYISGRGSIEGKDVILMEPQTFMNKSGPAVKAVIDFLKIPAENLIVIHDDIDMETGRIKLKRGGSSGGHRGVQSIIQSIGTKAFIRVKIGVGRDAEIPPEEYVLKKFNKPDMPLIKEAVITAVDAVSAVISHSMSYAMNIFNKKFGKL